MPDRKISWKTKADGWVMVDDPEIVAMLEKTTRAPVELSAFGCLIVPQWVIDSIEMYKKDGGYAGMSLFEWLDKLAGDMVEEPKHTF